MSESGDSEPVVETTTKAGDARRTRVDDRPEECISQETLQTADYDEVADRAEVTPDTVVAVVKAFAAIERDRRPWRDPTTLARLYYDGGLTQGEIADELGCKQRAVSRWMKRYDIAPGRGQQPLIRAQPQGGEDGGG